MKQRNKSRKRDEDYENGEALEKKFLEFSNLRRYLKLHHLFMQSTCPHCLKSVGKLKKSSHDWIAKDIHCLHLTPRHSTRNCFFFEVYQMCVNNFNRYLIKRKWCLPTSAYRNLLFSFNIYTTIVAQIFNAKSSVFHRLQAALFE